MDEHIIQWCQRLVRCRSVTTEGTREIAELCARELLAPRGLEPRLLPSTSEGRDQVNLLSIVRGRERACAPLVLNTHLDTVPPGEPAAWSECGAQPFAATIKGDRIYGLGTADTKLDFIAKALALAECGIPRRDVYLVATFGEEHGLIGAREMANAAILPKGSLAFVGEPSGLQLITAHKGLMVFQLKLRFHPCQPIGRDHSRYRTIFEGRAAHSSTPALGLNAIRQAIEALAARPDLQLVSIVGGDAVNKVPARCAAINVGAAPFSSSARIDAGLASDATVIPAEVVALLSRFIHALADFAERSGKPEADYAPPTLTCNAGVIRTLGSAILLDFELRPPPALALDEIRRGVDEVVARCSRCWPTIETSVVESRANPAFRSVLTDETVELARSAMAAAELAPATGVKAGCTEAGIYAAAGLRPVVFGPGPSTGVIHAPNEYNLISAVEGALRFYRELLRR